MMQSKMSSAMQTTKLRYRLVSDGLLMHTMLGYDRPNSHSMTLFFLRISKRSRAECIQRDSERKQLLNRRANYLNKQLCILYAQIESNRTQEANVCPQFESILGNKSKQWKRLLRSRFRKLIDSLTPLETKRCRWPATDLNKWNVYLFDCWNRLNLWFHLFITNQTSKLQWLRHFSDSRPPSEWWLVSCRWFEWNEEFSTSVSTE